MITVKEFPNKIFDTKAELFESLVANKEELIQLKKASIKNCDPVSFLSAKTSANKALSTKFQDDPASGILKRNIIGNTYYWQDKHDDVHLKSTFKKSIQENKARIRFYHDHINQVSAKVGKFSDVYELNVSWGDLGINQKGSTTIVLAEAEIIKDYNPSVFKQYLDGDIDQHSVGMIYGDIKLAINNPEMKEEYAEFNKHIDDIGNKDYTYERGFYWAVYQAKLIEISAVTDGSNEITYTLPNEKTEPSNDTLTKDTLNEPSKTINLTKVLNELKKDFKL